MLLAAAPAAKADCGAGTPESEQIVADRFMLRGDAERRIDWPAVPPQDVLVYALEHGVDVELEIHDAEDAIIGRADSPVARVGIQRVFLPANAPRPAYLIVRGHEHPKVTGTVQVRIVRLPRTPDSDTCTNMERQLAVAERMYAEAHAIRRGHVDGTGVADAVPRANDLFEAAAAQYERTAARLNEQTHGADLGEIRLMLAALFYYDLQEWSKSADYAGRAAKALHAAQREYLSARAQAIQAAAWLEIATQTSGKTARSEIPEEAHALFDKARALLAKLEAFHRARKEPYDRALQINNIGLSWFYEARFESALPYFKQAQAAFEALGEVPRAAVALQNIAVCEWGLGRPSAAVPMFERALSLMSPQPYPDLYLVTLSNDALANYAAGRFDESLRLHSRMLDLATRFQMPRSKARAYYGMGVTYYAIGDRNLAARFLRSALDILTPQLDARSRVAALRALAVIELETGDAAQAVAHDSEALRLATAPSARSRILLRLAMDYAAQGNVTAAHGLLDSLANFPPNGDALVQALALVQRAKLRRGAGDLELARSDVRQALEQLEHFDAVTDEFEARVELARIEQALGHDEAALAVLDKALAHTGEITSQTANPEYRASIAQSVRPALDLKIDLLWKRYQRALASRAASAARAAMFESLRTADGSRAQAFEQIRAQLLEKVSDPRIAELQRSTAALYRSLAEHRLLLATREDRYGPDDPVAQKLREDIFRLRARLGVVDAELATRAAPASKGEAGRAPDWVDHLLAAPASKAFIEYWIGANAAYVWTIAGGKLTWRRLESSAEIERVSRTLHESMRSYASTPMSERLENGTALYRLVLEPVRAQLTGATELTIVPDGFLHYVPFAALRLPAGSDAPYLAQRFAIQLAPALRFALSPDAPRPRTWADSRMLLVADPVYSADDPRLPRSAARRTPERRLGRALVMRGEQVNPTSLERLVSSAREAEQIRSLSGLGEVDVLTGLDATRANVLAHNLTQYRFIHIASHGFIDSEIPQLSALVLGAWDYRGRVADPYIRAGDLLSRTFDAEVVVLSACDTALGRQVSGEGIVGLRYAALARGARAVVASLWPVSDAIAADLMTDMYRNVTVEGDTVAAALSAAIRAQLARRPGLDPALWAPFAVYVAADRR